MVDEPKDTVTESEKKILRGLPDLDHSDVRKVLDYLGKTVFNKPKEIEHHSLAFKVAVVEILDKCGDLLDKQKEIAPLSDLPHTLDRYRNIIGGYGNKMFAAISSNEVKPTEEIEAFKKNGEQIFGSVEHLQKISTQITPSNCESQLRPFMTLVTKAYGIPIPKIKVVMPGREIGSEAMANAGIDGVVKLNQKMSFGADGKLAENNVVGVATYLAHELLHLKDFQSRFSYGNSPDSKIPLFQQILVGGQRPKDFHQKILSRLFSATSGIERFTRSESNYGDNGVELHDHNPLERRAIQMEEAFHDIRKKELQPEIQKVKLGITRFVDTIFYLENHNGQINLNDESYLRLDDKYKKILRDSGPITDDKKASKLFLNNKDLNREIDFYYKKQCRDYIELRENQASTALLAVTWRSPPDIGPACYRPHQGCSAPLYNPV